MLCPRCNHKFWPYSAKAIEFHSWYRKLQCPNCDYWSRPSKKYYRYLTSTIIMLSITVYSFIYAEKNNNEYVWLGYIFGAVTLFLVIITIKNLKLIPMHRGDYSNEQLASKFGSKEIMKKFANAKRK